MNKLTTPVRRFCQAILRQYPLMKKELAALEEEKQAIAEKVPVATWQEPVRVKAIGDRTANQAFKLLRLEEMWSKTRFYVQAVEDLLAYLDEEKRKLIELHYFDGYPIWKVALKMGIDESTFHRYQTAILILLANRLGL
ncbi:MAG TPA: sigma factor-like helix-turn-helix DNA-binding protein [Oculatellaceae cyanobacterium]